MHRDEQAAVGAGDDAELDLLRRAKVAGAEAQAGRLRTVDDVEGAVGGRRHLLGRLGRGGGLLGVGHRSAWGAPRASSSGRV